MRCEFFGHHLQRADDALGAGAKAHGGQSLGGAAGCRGRAHDDGRLPHPAQCVLRRGAPPKKPHFDIVTFIVPFQIGHQAAAEILSCYCVGSPDC